jgi:transposase
MIQINFSEEEQEALFEKLRGDKKEGNIRIRLLALHLKSCGVSHETIGSICRISRPTLATYLKEWTEGGMEELTSVNFYQPISELKSYEQELKKYFEAYPPRNSNEARAKIKEMTGMERCPTQVRAFMASIGMKIRKVGFVPAKAHTETKRQEQEEFKKNDGTIVGRSKGR